MKRILFLTHANPQGYRIQQYFPFLEDLGFTVELVTTRTGFLTLLDRVRGARVVYIQRILFSPLKLALVRSLAHRLVYDFDDAVMYGASGDSGTRQRKFKAMVTAADAVLCGNRFLLEEARQHRDRGAHFVPTVVDTRDYGIKIHQERSPLTVGWMGSSSTLRYFGEMTETFQALAGSGAVAFKVVADRAPEITFHNLFFERWRKDRERDFLLSFDVGVMPLKDDLWSRGKCGLKLLQYMASGLPSVTHPFGVTGEMVTDGETGFLRPDKEGWKDAITRLSRDTTLRADMGKAARSMVEEKYSLAVWGPRVARLLADL